MKLSKIISWPELQENDPVPRFKKKKKKESRTKKFPEFKTKSH